MEEEKHKEKIIQGTAAQSTADVRLSQAKAERAFSESSVEGMNRRGRPLGTWKDRVKEYVSERGVRGNGLSGREGNAWIGRSVCRGHPLWGRFRRERGIRAID